MAVMKHAMDRQKGRQDTMGLGRGSAAAEEMVLPVLRHGNNVGFGAVSVAGVMVVDEAVQ